LTLSEKACRLLPNAKIYSVSAEAGFPYPLNVGGHDPSNANMQPNAMIGGYDLLVNLDSFNVDLFDWAGLKTGFNAGAGASVAVGYATNVSRDNRNYSGRFEAWEASIQPFDDVVSVGVSYAQGDLPKTGEWDRVRMLMGSASVGLPVPQPPVTGNYLETDYSVPRRVPPFVADAVLQNLSFSDVALHCLRQAMCNVPPPTRTAPVPRVSPWPL
jgi:hypothetical protein